MRKGHRTSQPILEMLEDRTVPATVRLLGSGLYISNAVAVAGTTNVEVRAVANNKFEVYDNGNKIGTFNVGGTINYTGTNLADTLTVNLQGNTFTGNLFASMGNGNDTVDVTGGGALLGGANVQTGFGNDTTNLNSTGAAAMNFGGSIQVTDQLGTDTVNLGNAGAVTKFLGSVQLTNTNTVNAGAGAADLIGGDFTVSSVTENTPVALTVADNFTVNGFTTVRGGNVADTVDLGVATFNKNAQFLMGAGDDAVNFNGVGLTFNGNLDVDLGGGTNAVTMSNAFSVGGSMNLRNGDGDFTVDDFNGTINGNFSTTFGNGAVAFDTAATALVAGAMTYNAGNGTNNINIQNNVGGALSIFLGHGDGNLTAVAGTASIGGKLIFRSGNGGNLLLLASTASLYNLDVLFGSGDDTLIYGPGISVTGMVDGGGGTNLLIDGGATFVPPYTQANF
jgi:hypothetical protein